MISGKCSSCSKDSTSWHLTRADLTRADLTCADLTGLNIPTVENIDAKILASIEAGGKLEMKAWHSCETTHCRAGWACLLAGYAGGLLEGKTSSYLAGRLIYEKSRPGIPYPDFFATNNDALEDIRKHAALQTEKQK